MNSADHIWQQIVSEAELAAAAEPALADYLRAAVLSLQSLEDSLAYRLAEQLGSETVTFEQCRDLFCSVLAQDQSIGEKVRRDLAAHVERDPACDQYLMPLLYFKGFHALQTHRIAHRLWLDGRQSAALYLQNRVSEVFAVDIHPAARIGGGIMIDHATGVVIGETSVIEDNVSLLHSVTLGGTGNDIGDRHPKIRCGVLIAAGAKILGNIEVGAGAKIGAGSLVLEAVPPHTTVAGVPAKMVGRPREESPALGMDQHIEEDSL